MSKTVEIKYHPCKQHCYHQSTAPFLLYCCKCGDTKVTEEPELVGKILEAHNAVIAQLFEEIEKTLAHEDYTGRKRSVSFVLESEPWQALKQKYGVSVGD